VFGVEEDMGHAPRWHVLSVVLSLQVVFAVLLAGMANCQGLQTSPYSAPSMLRGLSGAAPSNSLGLPGSFSQQTMGSDTVSLSSGMFPNILPPIPNLQFGYLYNFGPNVRSGRGTVDYILPFSLSKNSVLFGEAHSEFQSFWKKDNGFNNRTDVSLGGGYRRIFKDTTLLGVNGFYDTTKLGSKWYSSGGLGLQMAALLPGNDAVDINFNWYGKLFDSNVIRNAFRFGPSNYDFQAGYSHELWNGGPDLRLSATGYMFDIGNNVYGWNAGAELKSRDGMFVLKYDVGNDRINETYQTVGAFVNVGFQLENVLKGESPFTKPEPIFKSPRNLTYLLTQTLNRNWYQPHALVVTRGTAGKTEKTTWKVLATRSLVGWPPIMPGFSFFLGFGPSVSFASVASANRVVITVQNPPPSPNGGLVRVFSIFGPGGFTGAETVSAGVNQIIVTSADWTRGTGLVGTDFMGVALDNDAGNATNWTPVKVTIEWQE
jgi:hypothetical protein